jgi:hypothetical protein
MRNVGRCGGRSDAGARRNRCGGARTIHVRSRQRVPGRELDVQRRRAPPCEAVHDPDECISRPEITGVNGQTFTSASFTLASATQCQGGSPRFNVFTSAGTFFLGCNNVAPTMNADGTATYTFTAATLAAAGQQVPTPTGTISSAEVLIDVQGTADLTNITFNGAAQVPLVGPPTTKAQCKNGGWRSFTNPTFKNQGQCVSFVVHHTQHGKSHTVHGSQKPHKH